jgi:hypothetical protein
MIKTRKVKIYIVNIEEYKPMYINVKEYETGIFNCYFLDPDVINEFKVEGFKVRYNEGLENYIHQGKLNEKLVSKIWNKIVEKKDNPDIEFKVKKND